MIPKGNFPERKIIWERGGLLDRLTALEGYSYPLVPTTAPAPSVMDVITGQVADDHNGNVNPTTNVAWHGGVFYLVQIRSTSQGYLDVYSSSDNGATWTLAANQDVGDNITAYSIEAGPNGLEIIYIVTEDYCYHLTWSYGGTFGTATQLVSASYVRYPDIAIDSVGDLWAVWGDYTTGSTHARHRLNGVWQTAETVYGGWNTATHVIVDKDDVPQVAYDGSWRYRAAENNWPETAWANQHKAWPCCDYTSGDLYVFLLNQADDVGCRRKPYGAAWDATYYGVTTYHQDRYTDFGACLDNNAYLWAMAACKGFGDYPDDYSVVREYRTGYGGIQQGEVMVALADASYRYPSGGSGKGICSPTGRYQSYDGVIFTYDWQDKATNKHYWRSYAYAPIEPTSTTYAGNPPASGQVSGLALAGSADAELLAYLGM